MARRAVELLKKSDPNNLTNGMHLAWLMEHARDTWRKTRQKAADVGSQVHARLEAELYRRSDLPFDKPAPTIELSYFLQEQADAAFDAGCRYFDEHAIELLQAESPRYSREHRAIGTGDLVARIDDELAIADYKTSLALYPTVWLQTAAYQRFFEEEYSNQTITKRVGINVGKDGRLYVETRDNNTLENDFKCFLALLEVWRWRQANPNKKARPHLALSQ